MAPNQLPINKEGAIVEVLVGTLITLQLLYRLVEGKQPVLK